MSVPARVYELVERFDRNREAYLRNYNETQVRGDFIDPLLEELGWDVHNRQGYPEAYRQVIEEDKLKVGGGTKAPDYGFYVGGTRKFYLEAKQPSVDIAGDVAPAVQLRRYAWTAQLPLSIVSDFEEFAFYDCRFEPQKTDKATTALQELITYDKYADRWDQISSVFSYEAVRDGSLNKFAETTKRKRGTRTVDEAFLKEIEGWREALARDLALSNALNRRQLNYAVQMTIDRIIFLRMTEDRGIEDYGRLLDLAKGSNVYQRLCGLFKDADERYNSGLFHFREKERKNADHLTLSLRFDDELLRSIIEGLYYPESPYEFGVLPEGVLGQVYERFLGKVIRLESDGNRAVVEEKPEARKAGGVYYTPTYIVDYIVENTVGKLLEKKTPEQALKLKIVDPACGSGSFLLGAYRYLLDWYCNRYLESGLKKHLNKLYQGAGGRWMLTIDEKKRILLNNIYGVDVDSQAVEVTKLSLLLKVLEGESEQTLEMQLKMFHERALPDLDNNIKSGNSLIGPDLYEDEQMMLLDEEEHYRINVFDWKSAFPQVFTDDNPGFDAVIGNPPYVRVHRLPEQDKQYFWDHYETFVAKSDIYACFLEKGVQILRSGGRLSYITPNTWTSLESFTNLRRFVLGNTLIEQMVKTPDKVFQDATVRTFLFVLKKPANSDETGASEVLIREMDEGGEARDSHRVGQRAMEASHLSNLLLHSGDAAPALFAKCTQSDVTVGSEFEFYYGFKTADDVRFLAPEPLSDSYEPFIRSAAVSRYSIARPGEFVDYRPDAMRANRKTARPGDRQRFERPKVIVARMGKRLLATLDLSGVFVKDAMLLLSPTDSNDQLKTLTGLLNSRLLQYLYENHFATIDVLKNALLTLPLPLLSVDADGDAARRRMAVLVDRMLTLQEKLATARISQEKSIIQHQVEATDRQIDQLVYELYGLTEEEIKVVEGR